MTIRNLEYLFRPRSVALIGASDEKGSVGATVMRNLLSAGFDGPIWPVNPKHRTIAGRRAYASVSELPATPDLAVVSTPAATIPKIIAELGEKGAKAAVVLTAGLARLRDAAGVTLQSAMLEAARPHCLRILGPNCVGLLLPPLNLNASFAHTHALPGNVAFVSQSGALTTALLDWAKTNAFGFSHFVSLGDSADVDFGDVLDYLASDAGTRAILLYIESVKHARKFMSAARAAARNKPVIVVKSGRASEGAKAAASHTGALAGADDVYDAAIRRAGMLRVSTTRELFDAAETLARAKPLYGDRLAIMTNGGGAGVVATDALIAAGGKLAPLSAHTVERLNAALPPFWSHANPVDIIGDAPAARYAQTLEALIEDDTTDAVLFIHAPTAIVASAEIAAACVPVISSTRRNVLACWMGGEGLREADALFSAAGIPTYATPEEAVRAFSQLVDYRRNQDMLMQIPPSLPGDLIPDCEAAREVIAQALSAGTGLLSEPDAKAVLAAYGIPVVATRVARDADEAVLHAQEIGFPVALKILSPDISHKSDVGGVKLDIASAAELTAAAGAMQVRCAELRPNARFAGFTVQKMVNARRAHELIAGMSTDPVFGPIILFGQGGTAVEIIADKAIALPPLNLHLAAELVSRTRTSKLLAGYRDRPPIDHQALYRALVQLSQLISDIPEVVELDINPLLADEDRVIALDARVKIARSKLGGAERFAIRPYPKELEQNIEFDGRALLLRPIRPEDEPGLRDLLARNTAEDIHFRFFHALKELPHSQLARFTQIDYHREMAFVAKAGNEILGEVRAIADPDEERAEFAILVRSDLKGKGLGRILLSKLVGYCRSRGIAEVWGEVLAGNVRMLSLARDLGFAATPSSDGSVRVRLRVL